LGGPPRGWWRAPWVHAGALLTVAGPVMVIILNVLGSPDAIGVADVSDHGAVIDMWIGLFLAMLLLATSTLAAFVSGVVSLLRPEPRRPLAILVVLLNGVLLFAAGWLLSGRTL